MLHSTLCTTLHGATQGKDKDTHKGEKEVYI